MSCSDLTYSEQYSRIACSPLYPSSWAVESSNGIFDSVFIIAKDVIRLNFSFAVAVTESLLDPSSYIITSGTEVIDVLPIVGDPDAATTMNVYLKLSPKATHGTDYEITLPSAGDVAFIDPNERPAETIFLPSGAPLSTMSTEWTHQYTKVDAILAKFSNMYAKNLGSNCREILQAISISDEIIGGEKPARQQIIERLLYPIP
jgi:hypothetical protein